MAQSIQAKTIISSPMPNLLVGKSRTKSSAIHPLRFVGRLSKWNDFEGSVHDLIPQYSWQNRVLGYKGPSTSWNMVEREQIVVGDESGVVGRFNQNVSHVVTCACVATKKDIRFGDYKVSYDRLIDPKVPDVVGITPDGKLRFVGELKAPWVRAHNLLGAIIKINKLRHILGQLAMYMRKSQKRFGFVSTYDYTIFVRQTELNGQWGLEYSRAIGHSEAYGTQRGQITARQAVYCMASSSLTPRYEVQNNVPMGQWVEKF